MQPDFLTVLTEFFASANLQIILVLIALDLAFGIAAAIRRGKFEWNKIATFYGTNVLPYSIGYLIVYTANQFVPEAIKLIGDTLHLTFYGALTINLLASIGTNLKELDINLPR